MKIREGFVTNSSSSSFVVVIKNEDADVKSVLKNILALPKKHPLRDFADDIASTFESCLNKYYSKHFTKEDAQYVNDEYSWGSDTKLFDLLIKYGNLHLGSFDDDGDNAERWLCCTDLNYEDDDIIIMHEGGY